ncbi:B-box zinc finger protein [Alloacidobacterium dinghuense]|uniref:B-box zinc finger protein n=1 Tax=Alloacidobacterium dinghuense TaxID=2763107 RepID=A0A7G8BEW1_9BACT|nr:B-box zinc finger protein [Alloacidobacterium dinghuense]QNI31081.1 B-box zinc finger protein [Alloacidobacterium dinghuense]
MNCANHPDLPVAAYCQNCGKPLCTQCVRSISGVIYCEPCLAAKLGVSGATPTAAPGAPIPVESDGPNPALAFVLGFIPGVGAMFNGQFIKALIHVLVFVVLIGITNEHPLFGIFIAAWVFYQVFDAYQTAQARRNGLPLPDPFGLNELGQRLVPNRSYAAPPMGAVPPQGQYQAPPVPPPSGYGEPYTPVDPYAAVPPVPPIPPIPPMLPDLPGRRPEPVGAIVLIIVGMLFLFSTLHIFRFDWIGRGWPVLVIVIGVWLLVRRTREVPPPPAPPSGGAQ